MAWLTVAEAAAEAKRHPRTISDACRAKTLHGVQRSVNASWRVEDVCLDAWVRGTSCPHQQTNVIPFRQSA